MTLDEYERLSNRARFLEEATHGIYALLETNGKNRSWLARRLGKSRAFVSKILEGSHNFTLETLADVYLALGKSAHLTLGSDPEELRLPINEDDWSWRSYNFDLHALIAEGSWEQVSADPSGDDFVYLPSDQPEGVSWSLIHAIARSQSGLGEEFTVADEVTHQDTLASRFKRFGSDVLQG